MKKKFAAILCTFALLATCLCFSAFAAGKPSIELMSLYATWNSNRVYAPKICFRVNSAKTIKYADWYITAYNRVGDRISDDVLGATKKLTEIGPLTTFSLQRSSEYPLETQYDASEDSPFRHYKRAPYKIAIGDDVCWVFQDEYDNFFVCPSGNSSNECVYLSEDEIVNAMFDYDVAEFPDIAWYSRVVDYLQVDKVVLTYIDGTTETLTNVDSKYRDMSLQNPPFVQQLAQYQAVYNYQDYLNCNPDLATQFGANQKALFEHFVTQGMKEGRQGSAEFNLNAYKANNPDLVAMFGNDNVKYYEHFISSGRAEGRVAV